MNFFKKIWEWIKSLFGGNGNKIKKVEIGNRIFAPLFLRNLSGGVIATWAYMSQNDSERKNIRNQIKSKAVSGETPAITFILTPYNENGHTIPDDMSNVSDNALNTIRAMCEELVKDDIAIFLCLYVDDHVPFWMEIGKNNHIEIWKKVHNKVGDIINGYLLSIETNEKATSKGHIEGCINVMRNAMPGADYYSTHLQWIANNGRYSWIGGNTTPNNINLVWVEYSWDPRNGDAVGVEKMKNEYGAINHNNQNINLVHQEYNLNSGSATEGLQRAYLRSQRAWGIG